MARYVSVLPSATHTADVVSKNFDNWDDHSAMHVVVDISSGSPNLVVAINGFDGASNKNYALLTSATINASGVTVLKIGPDYTAATNVAKDYVPAYWNVTVTQSGGVSAVYSLAASLIGG